MYHQGHHRAWSGIPWTALLLAIEQGQTYEQQRRPVRALRSLPGCFSEWRSTAVRKATSAERAGSYMSSILHLATGELALRCM